MGSFLLYLRLSDSLRRSKNLPSCKTDEHEINQKQFSCDLLTFLKIASISRLTSVKSQTIDTNLMFDMMSGYNLGKLQPRRVFPVQCIML